MVTSTQSPVNQHHTRVRVLIVDDSPQVRHDLHQFLDLTGEMEVVAEATNGQEAVNWAVELSPDVIIMDLEMPGMDGFEAIRQIKTRGLTSRLVVLSMHASTEDVVRAKSAGADEFVVKGANFKALIDAILGRNDSPEPTAS